MNEAQCLAAPTGSELKEWLSYKGPGNRRKVAFMQMSFNSDACMSHGRRGKSAAGMESGGCLASSLLASVGAGIPRGAPGFCLQLR